MPLEDTWQVGKYREKKQQTKRKTVGDTILVVPTSTRCNVIDFDSAIFAVHNPLLVKLNITVRCKGARDLTWQVFRKFIQPMCLQKKTEIYDVALTFQLIFSHAFQK